MTLQGRLLIESVYSPALEGNLYGDPATREVVVYLPPSYDREPTRRYPVIYALHGFTGWSRSWLSGRPLHPTLPERADRLMVEGQCPEVILVMPDGWSCFGGGQYINSAANGRHEDYICQDVVAAIDQRFRTLPDRAHRAIMGKSSGGYGALVLAMRHPDRFSAMACHSGDMYFELCYKIDFPRFVKGLARVGGLERFVAEFRTIARNGGEVGDVLSVLGMAAAYSPNPDKPPAYCDLPVDPETCALDEAVWQRWLAHDPVYLVEQAATALRTYKLLYFDAGDRDEYHLQFGARILTRRLAALGIPYTYEEFSGGHSNTDHRYEVSLPALAHAIAAG